MPSALRVAWRRMARDPVATLIAVVSLGMGAAGMYGALSVLVYHTSYEKGNPIAEQVFRVVWSHNARQAAGVGPWCQQTFPAVSSAARLTRFSPILWSNGQKLQTSVTMADTAVFTLLDVRMVRGEVEALAAPFTMALSESEASRWFGDEDPIGEVLLWDGSIPYRIVGIFKDMPANRHFRTRVIASLRSMEEQRGGFGVHHIANWEVLFFHTYLQVPSRDSDVLRELERAIEEEYAKRTGSESHEGGITLQPLKSIHLGSKLPNELAEPGDWGRIYGILSVGVLLLLLAYGNYANLEMAESIERLPGMLTRKAFGASLGDLMLEQSAEIALRAFLGWAVGLSALAALQNAGVLELRSSGTGVVVILGLGCLLMAFLIGLLAVLLPYGRLHWRQSASLVHAGGKSGVVPLNALQVVVTVAALMVAVVIWQQERFMRNRDLGFDPSGVLVTHRHSEEIHQRTEDLIERVGQMPFVSGVTAAHRVPGLGSGLLGTVNHAGRESRCMLYPGRHDFLEFYRVALVSGRYLRDGDGRDVCVVNETALRALGIRLEEALGSEVSWTSARSISGRTQFAGTVVGVIRDAHFQSLHHPILPLVAFNEPAYAYMFSIRMRNPEDEVGLRAIEKMWNQVVPEKPANFHWLEHAIAARYGDDLRTASLMQVLTVVALVSSCLGLLAQGRVEARRRARETAIRLVLGGSPERVAFGATSPHLRRCAISLLVAVPLGFWGASEWVQRYAYRVDGGSPLLVVSLLLVMGVIAGSVYFPSWHASRRPAAGALREN